MKTPLLRSPMHNGLYSLPLSASFSTPQLHVGERTSSTQWHTCFGHLSLQLAQCIIKSHHLPATSSTTSTICSTCRQAKSTQICVNFRKKLLSQWIQTPNLPVGNIDLTCESVPWAEDHYSSKYGKLEVTHMYREALSNGTYVCACITHQETKCKNICRSCES